MRLTRRIVMQWVPSNLPQNKQHQLNEPVEVNKNIMIYVKKANTVQVLISVDRTSCCLKQGVAGGSEDSKVCRYFL